MTIPLAVAAGFAPGAIRVWAFRDQGPEGMARQLAYAYAGFDSNRFAPEGFKYGLYPMLAGMGVHMLASKLGLNRVLARSGIPLIRI